MTQLQLFTQVSAYYTSLQAALSAAKQHIHLAAYAFDDGQVARSVGHILAQKAASGVAVHLMVDEAGLYLDNWPNGRRLSQFNRLHCKFCAIDDQVAFVGGSNVGDYYLQWRDTNLRLNGRFGDGFRRLYDSLRAFGGNGRFPTCPPVLSVADMPLLLTVPGHRQDIRRALLDLILSAQTAVSLRSWYFLPDAEIMNALLSQAENGVRVTILLSHQTRISLIDLVNRRLCRRLAQAGAHIYRYNGRFMHAKEAWNDQGEVLLGSANIDRWALRTNFECCLHLHDLALASQLSRECLADVAYCRPRAVEGAERPLLC